MALIATSLVRCFSGFDESPKGKKAMHYKLFFQRLLDNPY